MNSVQYTNINAALANENRVRIIEMLANEGEQCAQSLLQNFDIKQPTMSQHIKILRHCGLIDVKKEGRWQYFSVNTALLQEYLGYIQNTLLLPAIRYQHSVQNKR